MEIIARVPGKIMLAGEYAVLQGAPSLTMCIDRFLTARIVIPTSPALTEQTLTVHSNLWSSPRVVPQPFPASDDDLLMDAVLQAARRYHVSQAVVDISSELDIRFGLGSSSALRLAVFAGFAWISNGGKRHTEDSTSMWPAAQAAFDHQRQHQQTASGYDIVAQCAGGLVEWQPTANIWPGPIVSLPAPDDFSSWLTVWVGGRGAPTTETVFSGRRWLEQSPEGWKTLHRLTAPLHQGFKAAFASGGAAHDLPPLISAMGTLRQFWQQAPQYPGALENSLGPLIGLDRTWSWKPTGAGGEDAILLVGSPPDTSPATAALTQAGWYPLPLKITQQGLSLTHGLR